MNRLNVIFLLAFLLLVSACGRGLDARLELAESLTESSPDSALAILEGIDWRAIGPQSRRARYCLDYTDALYRSGTAPANDSMIRCAVDYYDAPAGDDSPALARALYYLARSNSSGSNTATIAYAMRACDIADSLRLDALSGDIWSLIAEKHEQSADVERSIAAYKEAADRYLAAGRTEDYQYSEITRAISHVVIPRPDEGIAILDSLLARDTLAQDYLRDYSLLAYAELNSVASRPSDAIRYLDSIPESSSYFEDDEIDQYLYVRAPILISLGRMDEARGILDYLRDTGRDAYSDYALMKYQYFKAAGQTDSALAWHERMSTERHGAMVRNFADNIMEGQSEFYAGQYRLKDEQSRRVVEHSRIFIGLILILACIAVTVFFRYIRRSRRELDEKIQAIEELKADANRMSSLMADMDIAMQALRREASAAKDTGKDEKSDTARLAAQIDFYSEQFSVIDRMLSNYSYEKSLPGGAAASKFEKYVQSAFSDDYFRRLEDGLDRIYNGLITSLRTEGPDMTDDDRHFLDLLILGLGSHAVGVVCRISNSYLHTRKSRLRRRIADSSWTRAADMLLLLDNRARKSQKNKSDS